MTNKILLFNAVNLFALATKNLETILEEENLSEVCVSNSRSSENLDLRCKIYDSCNEVLRYWLDHYETEEEG